MSEANVSEGLERLVEKYVLEVNEYDDRTSPEDWPEALLITSDELHDLLKRFAAELATLSPQASPQGVEGLREALEEAAELRFWLRRAGDVLKHHSADPPGTPTRDALVFVNAALNPHARSMVRAALSHPLSGDPI